MRSFTTLAITTFLSTLASAQYSIDPNTVPLTTRQIWCNDQQTECPLICLQTPGNSAATDSNTCDPVGLSYSCVCSNGISPNVSEYSQTLPYFVCTEWGNQCVTNCGNDNTCQSACRSQHPCGAQNPVRQNTSTLSSTMSSTSTGVPYGDPAQTSGAVYTGFAGVASTSTGAASAATTTGGSQSAAMALEVGKSYGLFMVAAGLFGGFAIML